MRCPVCKTECESSNTCNECGFSDVGKMFVNQEDATQWVNSVVIPYRDNYNNANILSPVDWLKVLKQNSQAKQLFEFSIPASLKRRVAFDQLKDPGDADYSIYQSDATLDHIAFISTSELVRKQFINVLNDSYLHITDFKRVVSACIEQTSDLAALLTNLSPGETLLFEINSKIKKDMVALMARALRDFSLDIILGKGPTARSILLDLPCFTAIFVADSVSAIPVDIANILSSIIEINPSQEELDELQIREVAPCYSIQLTKANVEVIKKALSQKNFKNVKSILRFISDYLYLHTEIHQPLSRNAMQEIIEQLS